MDNTERHDLRELYRKAFGVIALPYPGLGVKSPNLLPVGTVQAVASQYQKKTPSNREIDGSFEYSGMLGATYIMPVKLTPPNPVSGKFEDAFQLWNEPLVSLSGRKNIISTPIAGFQAKRDGGRRIGVVKELISIDDYVIRIRGFIIDPYNDDTYPKDQIRKFRQLVESDILEINCILTQMFDINYIVVTDFNLPEMAGYPGIQPYEITALSDEPFVFGIVGV